MKPRNTLLIIFLIAGIAASAVIPGGRPLQTQEKGAATIRVESNFVLVEATVKDKSGKLIDGLTADDFQVNDDGFPQTVAYFSRDELPLAVALAVDISESIVPYFDQLHDSMQTVLATLKPEDQVALFTFSNIVEKRADLTADKGAIAERFEGLTVGGSTNLNDGLYEAAHYLDERAPAMRRVIILVSDNVPSQEGKFSPKEVENEILKADAAVYSLRIPGENSAGVQLYIEQAQGQLVNVAKLVPHTGGEIIEVSKEGSLALAFAAIIQRLKARYTMGYAPIGHPLQDGRYHRVEAVLAPGKCKQCRVETKRGYFGTRPGGEVKKEAAPPPQSTGNDTPHSKEPALKPGRVRLGAAAASALLVYQVIPVYPLAAQELHVDGTVLLNVVIGKDGTVQNLVYVSGPEILKKSAMDAVGKWRYKPTLLMGEQVEVDTTIEVVYATDRKFASPESNASASEPKRVRVGGNVAAAMLVHQVAPGYPKDAKKKHIEGTVVLHAIIAKDGTLKTVEYVSGPSALTKSAMDAVKKWRYKPMLITGQPVEVDTTISVIYTLGGN